MFHLISSITSATTMFASTNIDDLVVVSALFADDRVHWRTIAAGQLLGIGALVALSVAIALAALVFPPKLFPYFGLIPLSLGVRRLWQCRQAQPPIAVFNHEGRKPPESSSGIFATTMVTIAAGSDNVTVYAPFFAKNPEQIPLYAATFLLLALFWCLFGYLLVNHSTIGRHLGRIGRLAVPTVMIFVGLWLLKDAAA